MKGLTDKELVMIGIVLSVIVGGTSLLLNAHFDWHLYTVYSGTSCSSHGMSEGQYQCFSDVSSTSGQLITATFKCSNNYLQYISDGCNIPTTTSTTQQSQCYDSTYGYVNPGYTYGWGPCNQASCTRDGVTIYNGQYGSMTCTNSGQWSFSLAGTQTTTTTQQQGCSNPTYSCVNNQLYLCLPGVANHMIEDCQAESKTCTIQNGVGNCGPFICNDCGIYNPCYDPTYGNVPHGYQFGWGPCTQWFCTRDGVTIWQGQYGSMTCNNGIWQFTLAGTTTSSSSSSSSSSTTTTTPCPTSNPFCLTQVQMMLILIGIIVVGYGIYYSTQKK